LSTALLILPNFVLILLGLVLARRFDYGRDFWSGMEKLVYYVLFPALLFRSLAIAKIDFAQSGWLAASACAFTLAGFALSLLAKPLFRLEDKLAATGSQCGYRFNTYVGLAVAGSLFGTQGVALAALLLGVMIPLANFCAVAVLAKHGERGFLAELVQHPLVVSSVLGFAWNAAGLALPGFADQTLSLLAQTALPAGLLAVGAAMRIEPGQGPVAAHAWWLGEACRGARDRVGARTRDRRQLHGHADPRAVRGAADRHQRIHPRHPHDRRRPRGGDPDHDRDGALDAHPSDLARHAGRLTRNFRADARM
jgi:hypothetical protein